MSPISHPSLCTLSACRLQHPGQIDLYAVGTQESGSLGEWEALLTRTLGPAYCRLAGSTLMNINLVLFLRRDLRPRVSEVLSSTVATGVGNMLGNKGGTAISLK